MFTKLHYVSFSRKSPVFIKSF